MMATVDEWGATHEIAFLGLVLVPLLILVFVDAIRERPHR